MVFNGSSNCIICRSCCDLSASTLKANIQSFADVFSAWKSECAIALCHVLFDKHVDYFVNYFRNNHYCSGCEQLVRDLSFTWKQIRLFQNRLHELSRNISQILDINYQLINDKSEPLVVEERVSYFVNTADPLKTPEYSYDEMVEVLYSAVSSGLSPYLNEKVVNSNPSLPNALKAYQNSATSPGEDSIPTTCFGGINKIKEECLYNNDADVEIDEQASYSPCYNENEDEPQIKSENDSISEEHLEPIRTGSKLLSTLSHKKPKQSKSSTHNVPEELKLVSSNDVTSYAYNCKFCGKGYIQEEELKTHYATSHQGSNPFTCAFCPLIFTSTWILSKHRKTAHPDPHESINRLKCKSCDLYFANKSSLSVHSRRHHRDPNSSLNCQFCSAYFRQPSSLNNHLLLHKFKSKFVCEICGKGHTSAHNLRNHSMTHRKNTKDEILLLQEKDSKQNKCNYDYECKFCCKGYITEEELNYHYAESHQGPNPFTCAFCPTVYSNSVDLSQHQKSTHPDTTKPLVGKLKCKSCDRYFSNKSSLRIHARNHLDASLLLKCHLCPATFTRNYLLNLHVASHRNERKHICEVCGKAYNREDALRKHLKVHDESNRKYQCSICDKKFFEKSYCKDHERTHTKMKEFICQICGKNFNRNWNLKEHLKIHTGIPPRIRAKRKSRKKQDLQLKNSSV